MPSAADFEQVVSGINFQRYVRDARTSQRLSWDRIVPQELVGSSAVDEPGAIFVAGQLAPASPALELASQLANHFSLKVSYNCEILIAEAAAPGAFLLTGANPTYLIDDIKARGIPADVQILGVDVPIMDKQ